jgi:hypothetical protein
MYKRIVIALMMASLSLGVQIQYPFGPEVRVRLKTGADYQGEILALRDSNVILSLIHGADSNLLARSKHSIIMLRHDAIHEVSLPGTGSSKALLGALLGAPSGCLAGYAIGDGQEVEQRRDDPYGCRAQDEKHRNQINGGLIGCFVGAALGAAVGGAASSNDMVLISPMNRDFSGLRILARYKGVEPAFLREVKLILVE